jgi:amino acid transporter
MVNKKYERKRRLEKWILVSGLIWSIFAVALLGTRGRVGVGYIAGGTVAWILGIVTIMGGIAFFTTIFLWSRVANKVEEFEHTVSQQEKKKVNPNVGRKTESDSTE